MASRLTTDVAGLRLDNPTILASGILGMTGLSLRAVIDAGAGAVVSKSVGLKPREGYPNPSVVQVDSGIINAMGLPNLGVGNLAEEIREIKRSGVPVIASVYGFSADEFAEVARAASKAGADALELNVSCPHVEKTGSEIGQDQHLMAEVVKHVKLSVDKPVIVKLTPNVASIADLAKTAVESGADAITAINTVKAMAIDAETARPVLANKIGGLSGPAIKPIAIRCVYEIYQTVKVPIIGCGGISSWRDAVEFMLAGASAVEVGTAVAFEGLGVFKYITKGIEAYLARNGFSAVKEIIGLAHKD